MIKKNDVFDVEIVDYGCNLEGIAKKDGVVLFVPNACVGECVTVQVINTKQKAYICKILEIKKPSEFRRGSKCEYYSKCGGCQAQHITYEKQLQLKHDLVFRAVEKIAKIDAVVSPCVESENQYYYRNKLALPINPLTKKVGMFRAGSHNIIDVNDCLIQEKWAKDLIKAVNEYIAESKISVFDEKENSGLIKHIVARHFGDQYLFTVVINGEKLPNHELLIEKLNEKFKNFGLNVNINKLANNVILSNNFKHIYGLKSIEINEFGINYNITNASFFQVNNDIKSKIYSTVLSEVGGEIVVDAYSGAGLMSAIVSRYAKQVFGIEIVPDAVKSADDLTKINGIKNLTNICGDTAVELPKLVKKIDGDFTLILDPPRKGCDKKVIETILKTKPNKIIYVSCNPSTLARDMGVLKEAYSVKSITPFDMFPQTCHVETLAVLQLK